MKRIFIAVSLIFVSFEVKANDEYLEDTRMVDDKWIFSVSWENDFFADDDDNYTNGVRFSWLSPETTTPHWLERIANASPFFDVMGKKRISYSLGQSMYTPESTVSTQLVRDQRPYAGWLYGSAGLISDTGDKLERLEVSVGVVGPSSLAYQTQREIHKARGIEVPRGWDNQLKDEPGFILSYENSWKNYADFGLLGLGADFVPKAGFALGNVHTNASIGATFRLGRDLPADYGPPKIRPRLPGSDYFVPSKDFGWYIFTDIEGRAVARNIFLDGNTWKDSHSVDKRHFVADAQAGIAFTFGNYRLAYTHTYRTKEFREQTDDIESFGALTLSIRY